MQDLGEKMETMTLSASNVITKLSRRPCFKDTLKGIMKEVTTPLNEDGNDDYCEYFRSRKEMDTEKYSVTNVITNIDQQLCFKGT